ncbi:MAG: hypothetical protein JXA21_05980 [Anaerolineae bacterium]|nr:hypothetical protein [Anaerolineae bacterium]
MKSHKHRNILLVLALASGVGLLLYFLARPAGAPRTLNNPLRASWRDSFENGYRIEEIPGAQFGPEGAGLSRIHDLGAAVPDANSIGPATVAPNGHLFAVISTGNNSFKYLLVYDPSSQQVTNLGKIMEQVYIDSLAVNTGRQEAYSGVRCQGTTCANHIVAYSFQSGESRHIPLSFASENDGIFDLVPTAKGTIYGITNGHLFSYNPKTDEIHDLTTIGERSYNAGKLVVGADGNLYGNTNSQGLYKYQIDTGELTWIPGCSQRVINRRLIQGPDEKIYVMGEYTSAFCTYDPKSGALNETSIEDASFTKVLGVRKNEVQDIEIIGERYNKLLSYNVNKATLTLLENFDPQKNPLITDADEHVYFDQYMQISTVRQAYESEWRKFYRAQYTKISPRLPVWARSWLPYLEPVDVCSRQFTPTHLWVYEPDMYVLEGALTSIPIQPNALLVTHTIFSGIPALTWGGDGALYGAGGYPPTIMRYDPQHLKVTNIISLPLSDVCSNCETQTITADPTGRVIAGIGISPGYRGSSAMLMIYDPRQNSTITVTVPVSGANVMKTLVSAPDGSLYGSYGQSSGYSNGMWEDHLFKYDSALGAAIDLGMPFTNTFWSIQALTVAPDGKVYGGGGPILSADSFYYQEVLSPGSRLFVYDPATQTFSYPGPDKVSGNRIRTLLAGPDGKIYIGMEIGEEKGFHIYDPATNHWTYWGIGEKGDGKWSYWYKDEESSADVIALTWGVNGIVYGSTVMHAFTYNPQKPNQPPVIIGKLDRAGFEQLLAGPDGVTYGATGRYAQLSRTIPELLAFRTDCAAGRVGAWERVTWEADTPRGTGIKIDVLDEDGNTLVKNIRNGGSLAGIDPAIYPTLRLHATLTTDDPAVSPVLKSWQVEYTFECQP